MSFIERKQRMKTSGRGEKIGVEKVFSSSETFALTVLRLEFCLFFFFKVNKYR